MADKPPSDAPATMPTDSSRATGSHTHESASEPSLGPSQPAPPHDMQHGSRATPRARMSKGGASSSMLMLPATPTALAMQHIDDGTPELSQNAPPAAGSHRKRAFEERMQLSLPKEKRPMQADEPTWHIARDEKIFGRASQRGEQRTSTQQQPASITAPLQPVLAASDESRMYRTIDSFLIAACS